MTRKAGEYTRHKVFYNDNGKMCREYVKYKNGVTSCRYRAIK